MTMAINITYSQENEEEFLYSTEVGDSTTLRNKGMQEWHILFIEILENQAEDLSYEAP